MKRPLLHTTSAIALTLMMAAATVGEAHAAPAQITPVIAPEGKFKPIAKVPAYRIDESGRVYSANGSYHFTYNAKTGQFFDGQVLIRDPGVIDRFKGVLAQINPPASTAPIRPIVSNNPTPAQLAPQQPGNYMPVEPQPPLTIDNEGTISHAPIKPIVPEGGPTLNPNTKAGVPQHGGGFIYNPDPDVDTRDPNPTPRPFGYTIDADGNVNSPNGYYLFTYNAKTGVFTDGKTKVLDPVTLERFKTILGQATPLQTSPLRPIVSNNPTPIDVPGDTGIYPRNTLPESVKPSGKTTNPTPAPRPAQLTLVDPGHSMPVEPNPPLTIDGEGTISHAPIKPIKPEGGPTLTPNTKSNVPQHGGGLIVNPETPWTVDPKTGVATHGVATPGTKLPKPIVSNNPTPADKVLDDQPPYGYDPLPPVRPRKPIVSNFPTPVDEGDGTEVNPTNTLTPKKPLKPIVSNFPTPIDEIGPGKSDKFKPIAKVPGKPIYTQPVEPIAPLTVDGEGTISHTPLPTKGVRTLDHGYTVDTKGIIKNPNGSTVGILKNNGALVDHAGKALPAASQKELQKLFRNISKAVDPVREAGTKPKVGVKYAVENGRLKLQHTGRPKNSDTTKPTLSIKQPQPAPVPGTKESLPKPIVSNNPTPAGSSMCVAPETLSREELKKYKCGDVLIPPMLPPKSPPIFGETVTLPPPGYILQATSPRLWMDEHGTIRDANNGIIGMQCAGCDQGTWLDAQEQPVSTDTAQEWYNLFRDLKPTPGFAYVPPKSPPIPEPAEPPTEKLPTLQSLGYHLMNNNQGLYLGHGVIYVRDDDGQPGMLFHDPSGSGRTIRVLDNGGVIISDPRGQIAPAEPTEEMPYVPLPTK